jgi:hypothetical protein
LNITVPNDLDSILIPTKEGNAQKSGYSALQVYNTAILQVNSDENFDQVNNNQINKMLSFHRISNSKKNQRQGVVLFDDAFNISSTIQLKT